MIPKDRAVQVDTEAADNGNLLLDLLIVLAKNKRKLICVPILVAAVTAGIALLIPDSFKATAKLMPPQGAQSGATALMSQFSGGASLGIPGLKNPGDLYVGMLKSRTIADNLVKRFDLKKVYGTASAERARLALASNTAITAGKDGIIQIDVQGRSKELVAKLSNAYVDELTQLTKTLAVTEAGRRRVFYEGQLEKAKDNLSQAEVELKNALDRHGMVSVDAQSQVTVETVSKLRAQITSKEIELSSLRAFLTPNHVDFKRKEEELASLKSELSKFEGQPTSSADSAETPDAKQVGSLANVRLVRNLKYSQMLYELLTKQYEAARLDEAKDPMVIQVLDPAVAPESKFKPRRGFMVEIAAVVALFGTLAWIYVFHVYQAIARSDAGVSRLRELRRLVTSI